MRHINFLKEINPASVVTIISHKDCVDGLVSATLMSKVLAKNRIKARIFFSSVKDVAKSVERFRNCDYLIILDLASEYYVDALSGIKAKVLVIDHHVVHKDGSNKNVVFINPRLEHKERYQPASYLIWKLFPEVKELNWLSAIGTTADYGYDDCRDLLDKFFKIDDKNKLLDTEMGLMGKMVAAAITKHGHRTTMNILYNAKSLKEIEKNKKFVEAFKEAETRFAAALEEFYTNKENYGNVVFSLLSEDNSRYGGAIGTKLSSQNNEEAYIIFAKLTSRECSVHGRTHNKKYNLAEAFKKVSHELGALGGGHEAASGSRIKIKQIGKFKELFLKHFQ
ncbi:MAG TPA: DHHA1 domain-containing protein [archaeon]|nr:DHHA1 domain-containing protein [archaeon]